jgi:hypothetical protein
LVTVAVTPRNILKPSCFRKGKKGKKRSDHKAIRRINKDNQITNEFDCSRKQKVLDDLETWLMIGPTS